MCGICGFIGDKSEKEKREKILEEMTDAIRHRGPDDRGLWMDENASFGFCRLSIIDLEKGAQPMKNKDGSLVLLFNGEIYNYKELRQELLQAGHEFVTASDTEVLLHGYEQWGADMLEKLRGMFAFVIWDSVKKKLFAARDFFGIKPLYYALLGDTFVFASEIKAILHHPAYKKELNEEALEQYLSFQYSVLDETFFKDIYSLPPGSFLSYRAGSVLLQIRKYFEPALEPLEDMEEEEWIGLIDRTVNRSVAAHMEADVEIGAFLSGGVDSGLLASEFSGKKVYTVGFGLEESPYNEVSQARQTAEQCSLEHRGKRIHEEEFWQAVPEVLYYLEEPLGDASAVALYFLSREAAKDVKVVISGEGADELFGGYRIYCEPEDLRRYQMLPQGLRQGLARLAKHLPKWKGRQFLIRGSKTIEERFIGNANIFSYEERRELLKKPTAAVSPQKLLEESYQRTQGMADAERMQDIDLRYWLVGDILKKADRMSMAHSLEVRVPYLDKEVFEVARSLPMNMKQRERVTKYALRKAAERHLTTDTTGRPKLGFPVPIRYWLRSEDGYARVKEVLEGKTAERYFHKEKLRKLLEEHRTGHQDHSRKLWTVYTFCLWYEIYFAEQSACDSKL